MKTSAITREGPVGVEIVRKTNTTILNYFCNGLVYSSHAIEHKNITMPEALVLLATEIRLGNVSFPKEK